MSIGQMRCFIDIVRPGYEKDAEGFSTKTDVVIVSTRAYREGRHGSEKWANRTAFTDSTDLFRFRVIPGVEYTAETTNATNTITATAAEGAEVTISINGSALANGGSARWNTGSNTVAVTVTQDGASRTYTVTVTKGEVQNG